MKQIHEGFKQFRTCKEIDLYVKLDINSDKLSKTKNVFVGMYLLILFIIFLINSSENFNLDRTHPFFDSLIMSTLYYLVFGIFIGLFIIRSYLEWRVSLKGVIFFTISLFFIFFVSNIFGWETNTFVVIVAFLSNWLIAFLIHYIAYLILNQVLNTNKHDYVFLNPLKSFGSISGMISFDLYFAREFKKLIKRKYKICSKKHIGPCRLDNKEICYSSWDAIKIENKYYIQFSNWINVIISIILTAHITLLTFTKIPLNDFLLFLIAFRILSRFIEISSAFFRDVVRVDDKIFFTSGFSQTIYIHRWRNSLLLKSGRISLAVHTLIEIIILFSSLYYLLTINFINENNCIHDFVVNFSEINFIYLDTLIYSISVTFMNLSYSTDFPNIYWTLAHVSQVTLNIVLIIFSVAAYLGLNNDLDEREQHFYTQTHILKERRKKKKNKL